MSKVPVSSVMMLSGSGSERGVALRSVRWSGMDSAPWVLTDTVMPASGWPLGPVTVPYTLRWASRCETMRLTSPLA